MARSLDEQERLLAADPRSPAFVELGTTLADGGLHARAAHVLRAGLADHPDLVQARLALARSLFELGDRRGALGEIVLVAARTREDPFAAQLANELLGSLGLASQIRIGDGAPEALTPRAAAAMDRHAMTPVNGAPGHARPSDALPGLVPLADPGADAGDRFEASGAVDLPDDVPVELAGGAAGSPRPVPAGAGSLAADRTEEARITAAYQQKLREGMPARPREAPRSFGRHRLAQAMGAALLVGGAAAAAYLVPRRTQGGEEVRAGVEAARTALARDTVGSLREAAQRLARVRALDPEGRDSASLAAQVNALLAAEHGDAAAGRAAKDLVASGRAGEGALAARWLLAEDESARAAAGESLTAAPPEAGPLLHALAARVQLARGRLDLAVHHLELAASASPPFVRALAGLGDLARRRGDLLEAMRFYEAAKSAQPTHPGAVLGAAEARLALGADLAPSLAELEAVSRDPGSAPPVADRLRLARVHARVLAASGRVGEAKRVLDDARRAGSRPAGTRAAKKAVAPARAERRRAR